MQMPVRQPPGQGICHPLRPAKPHLRGRILRDAGQIQPPGLLVQMQLVAHAGAMTELGQPLVVNGARQIRRALDQGDPLDPPPTGSQSLQPGNERRDTYPGPQSEGSTSPLRGNKGAIGAGHHHLIPDARLCHQLTGMIPERPYRDHQLAPIR